MSDVLKQDYVRNTIVHQQHDGEAIIMLLVNYGDFSNVVADDIIKTRCNKTTNIYIYIYISPTIHFDSMDV